MQLQAGTLTRKHEDALGGHPALSDYLQCHDQRVREGTLGRSV